MPRRIRKRWVLVLFLALAQGLYLGLALLGLSSRDGADAIPTPWLAIALALIPATTAVCAIVIRRGEIAVTGRTEDLNALVAERSAALLQSRGAVILGLAKLAESRDDQTGRHLERIRSYVRLLGEQMIGTHREVDAEFVETIADTSALHDIGKVGIPDAVLLKPGALTDAQFEIIRKHPLIAGDLLLAIKRRWDDSFLVTACEIAFAHHERYDGTGYPFGLAGEMIPLSARIVAVADVYDALTTSERVYKGPLPHDEARRIIVEGSGTHFDPEVVQAFVRTEDEFRRVVDLDGGPEAA